MSDINFKTNDSYISEDFVVDVPIRCWHTEMLDDLNDIHHRREQTVSIPLLFIDDPKNDVAIASHHLHLRS